MKYRIICFIILFMVSIFLVPQKVFSQQKDVWFKLKEFGVFTGYMEAGLKDKDDYKLVPVGVKYGFDALHIFRKMSGETGVDDTETNYVLQIMLEPYMGAIMSPDSNFETGFGLLLKYGHRFGRIMPFIQAGTGFQYMTQHLNEQSTQWNFQVQGGAGCSFFFRENKAINIEYRARHFSNASIKHPNTGVDLQGILIGYSYFY